MTSEISSQPRVLMIGGATYTDMVVCAFTKYLNEAGRFRCSVIGMGQHEGRPGEVDLTDFEKATAFPAPRDRGWGTLGISRMACDLASCCFSVGVLAGGADAIRTRSSGPLRSAIRRRMYKNAYARALPSLVSGYDLYHWHCMHWDRLAALQYFPTNAKIILTVWGSDLLRTSGLEAYRVQLAACARATVITVGSLELRETLLAKFGRSLFDKLRLATYGADYLAVCDPSRERRETFLRRLHIPVEKTVVCVGHSGHRQNQHVAVLNGFRALPREILQRIAILLPMTYGLRPEYRREVAAAAEKLNVPVHLFETFLSDEDLASLRQASDIFIHVPVSDQFSAAMCESLASGAVLIVGAWLPYSRLRLNDIYYREVAAVEEIASLTRQVIERLGDEQAKTVGNADKIRGIMSWSQVMPRWLQIYDELLSSK